MNNGGNGKMAKTRARQRDDCMALCPFLDYFNHANEGVSLLRLPCNTALALPLGHCRRSLPRAILALTCPQACTLLLCCLPVETLIVRRDV